jgi:hypothetical protein
MLAGEIVENRHKHASGQFGGGVRDEQSFDHDDHGKDIGKIRKGSKKKKTAKFSEEKRYICFAALKDIEFIGDKGKKDCQNPSQRGCDFVVQGNSLGKKQINEKIDQCGQQAKNNIGTGLAYVA